MQDWHLCKQATSSALVQKKKKKRTKKDGFYFDIIRLKKNAKLNFYGIKGFKRKREKKKKLREGYSHR